jgi:hypothetical protein
MEVGVKEATTKTTAAYAIAIEGSISSNNKNNNSDSCDRRVDVTAAAKTVFVKVAEAEVAATKHKYLQFLQLG